MSHVSDTFHADDGAKARYACDACRVRKATCSREPGGCQRCRSSQRPCLYSRSGVIRRSRRRKAEQRAANDDDDDGEDNDDTAFSVSPLDVDSVTPGGAGGSNKRRRADATVGVGVEQNNDLQPHVAVFIDSIRDRLDATATSGSGGGGNSRSNNGNSGNREHQEQNHHCQHQQRQQQQQQQQHQQSQHHQESFAALSSLSNAYAAVWQDSCQFDKMAMDAQTLFFPFEDQTPVWVEAFASTIREKGRPFLIPPPADVVAQLAAGRTHELLRDGHRAWVVMYYTLVLSLESSKGGHGNGGHGAAAEEEGGEEERKRMEQKHEQTKAQLRSNLWIALNDVRLLLEPTEVNIQALWLLACHPEEFTTPTLCWMLAASACRMLQALGIVDADEAEEVDDGLLVAVVVVASISNLRGKMTTTIPDDREARDRRILTFWNLNMLDKSLALIFCRPPSFHRAMAREIPLPTVRQLLPARPHRTAASAAAAEVEVPSLFGAHYFHQLHLLSQVMGDIWHCLYEQESDNRDDVTLRICAVRADLDSWHQRATEMIGAAALVEKPFLDATGAASVDLGLHHLTYHYHWLSILLARACPSPFPASTADVSGREVEEQENTRRFCLDASLKMLRMLDRLVSTSEEVYNGVVWQLICLPFTPFLILFRELLGPSPTPRPADRGGGGSGTGCKISQRQKQQKQREEYLAAMEMLPAFLTKLSLRNSMARNLEGAAAVFVRHARSIVFPSTDPPQSVTGSYLSPRLVRPEEGPSTPLPAPHHSSLGVPFSSFQWPPGSVLSAAADDVPAAVAVGESGGPTDAFRDLFNDLGFSDVPEWGTASTSGGEQCAWANDTFVESMLDSLMREQGLS